MSYTDIVGAPLEIVGQGQGISDEILGRNALIVREQAYTKARDFPLGFLSGPPPLGTPVAAAATTDVTAQPQRPFKVERLVIPSDIAGFFQINNVSVGADSQFVAVGQPVPGRTWQENSVGTSLKGDTAQISMTISINITNFSLAPVVFRCCILGPAVE